MAVSAVTIVLGFTRSVLLMRLLAPDQFGFVALALFFMTFLTPFSALGIDSALIQRETPGKEAFSTHFVIRLTLAIIILVLGLLASPVLRRIYADQAIVIDVFLVLLSINVLQASFSTPGVVLRRDMRFGAIALLNLLSSLAMTITAPLLAYLGAGVWSLVVEQAVGPVVRWIGLWVFLRAWPLSLRFDWGEARSLLRFGRHVLSAHILGILLDRFDDFWTGTALGPMPLGYYSRAYEVAQYPERVLATPITNVLFSTYAAVKEDAQELSRAFFRSSSFLVRVGLWVAAVLVVTAPEVTVILFGETWLPIVPVFRLMLIYIMLDPLYVNLSYLIIGAGQPGWLARARLVQTALFVAAVIVSARLWGINGVALAADLMMLGGTVILLVYSHRLVSFSLPRLFCWPVAATVVSTAIGAVLITATQWMCPWVGLILKALAVSATYGLILYLAERHVIHEYGAQILRPLWNKLWTRMP
jgi:O-antigen/teichoic acid export membrane protein